MAATVAEIDPRVWADEFDDLFAQVVAPFFSRREPRIRARGYLLGLMSENLIGGALPLMTCIFRRR